MSKLLLSFKLKAAYFVKIVIGSLFFSLLFMRMLRLISLFLFIILTFLALMRFTIQSEQVPEKKMDEMYDESLLFINNMQKLDDYWLNMIELKSPVDTAGQIHLLLDIIRKRFYHGYSHYNYRDNFLAYLSGKVVWSNLSAIVIPNDILKYPNAACSQQSIVMMEALKKHGYKVRKVGISGETGGHFCLEVFFSNKWHFYDPSGEPNIGKYFKTRPSMAELVNNKEKLKMVYEEKLEESELNKLFVNWYVGEINEYPAKKAIVFHNVTKFISSYGWLISLLLFLVLSYFSKKKA